jgi:hypothetical protein
MPLGPLLEGELREEGQARELVEALVGRICPRANPVRPGLLL